jgi:hypothetical protein
LDREKLSFLDEPEFSDQVIFFSSEKIEKKFKNLKFDLLIDFDMNIRFNGLDQLFLT